MGVVGRGRGRAGQGRGRGGGAGGRDCRGGRGGAGVAGWGAAQAKPGVAPRPGGRSGVCDAVVAAALVKHPVPALSCGALSIISERWRVL